ncbi:hypothetical protein SERLA73DRAFT_177357 [Serpula lacrymans var. lacrymans S7.3]|uniref:Nucleoporin NSP1 n=2 Tax=Serpula lacrymans var. lacrymans TaxID=341189 RepID=F8PNU5_SERL3|nr:uncharacterized protein SERLADRAFT_460912 [Serpula lacrymans var. lacrymans S7.9]EGO01822.1 hypothetical protein SERLA73DRAFT_177357 [Serpula lacrymans var. lacrymans S7.3]EGO27452.1 hypothetical protein SERLADRAFT_460912 [Serpula lacrymans var. lacrymans S7.9]
MSAFGSGLFDASKSSTTPKTTSSNFFSIPPASTTPTAGSTAPPTGGLFGSVAKPAESTPTAKFPGGSMFGGSLFGKKPEDSAPTPTSSSTGNATFPAFGAVNSTSSPAGGGLFGSSAKADAPATEKKDTPSFNLFGSKDTSGEKKDATPTPSILGSFGTKDSSGEKKEGTPAPATFNLFGTKNPVPEKKDTPSAPSFSLGDPSKDLSGEKKDALSGASNTKGAEADKSKDSSAPSQANISVAPPSMLRGKTIEEIVNKWTANLELHVREFSSFAGEVAVWDRALMENGNNLSALFSHVLAAEREQNEIDQSLDHIEQQQRDLLGALEGYERSTDELLGNQAGGLRALDTGPADSERDKSYTLATELHAQLDDLSGSLTQMIDSVNALSLSSAPSGGASQPFGTDDPMAQISHILSSHLESLQWIDNAVNLVETRVGEVEKRVQDVGAVSVGSTGGNFTRFRGFGSGR